MKRCPECRRDYYDDSLLYCLEDGIALVQGSVPSPEEPATIMLSEPAISADEFNDEPRTALLPSSTEPNEAATRAQIQATANPTDFAAAIQLHPHTASNKNTIIAGIFGILLVTLLGVGSYWYYGGSGKQIDSIAVMPFVNESGNADIEYLSDGMTETLMNSLSRLPGVNVQARSSVFRYKGRDTDAKTIGKELNVQAVLNGRVVQHGDDLVLYLELVDAQTGKRIWGDQYSRKQTDLVALQSEIARDVSSKLKSKLSGAEAARVEKNYTSNAEAYRLYLQGRYFLNDQASEQNLALAVSFFDKAVAKDPRYALAYAARAESYFLMGDLNLPMSEAKRKVEADVEMALAIDDGLEQARMLRANMEFQYNWDFALAEQDFRRVLETSPNYAEAHHQYAFYLALTGKTPEAIAELKLADQLDPVNPSIQIDKHMPFYLTRQFDLSIAQARKTIELFPDYFLGRVVLGSALCLRGDCSTGIRELEKARELEPIPLVLGELGFAYGKAGRKDEANKILAQLSEMSKTRHVAPWWFALIYIGLDDKDRAFASLEKAYNDRSWWILWIKMDPKVDSLRSDPRLVDLIRRINYPIG